MQVFFLGEGFFDWYALFFHIFVQIKSMKTLKKVMSVEKAAGQ